MDMSINGVNRRVTWRDSRFGIEVAASGVSAGGTVFPGTSQASCHESNLVRPPA